MNSFEQLVATRGLFGRESYSAWNGELYSRLCQESGTHFWSQSGKDVAATESYLSLLAEGLGRGYVTQAANPQFHEYFVRATKWRSVLEYWLVMDIPRQIAEVARSKRISLLANLWNLGENILREQSWIDPYIRKQVINNSPQLGNVETELTSWLDPLFREPKLARWMPPFAVEIVDGREIQDDFLPGEMTLSAPAIVCIADRRKEDVFGGIFLHEKSAQHIFHHVHLGAIGMADSANIAPQPGGIQINGHLVELPTVKNVHSYIACLNGVVVASAVDSQRIWIIRSQ